MFETIFLGLPGPTHHFAGLSGDNQASNLNRGAESSPRAAALQTLQLAEQLLSFGFRVALLPPQRRPQLALLATEFAGTPEEIIAQAAEKNPRHLEKAYSSSAMWAANAATVSPSPDTADGRLHLTTANLHTNLHRRIEAEDTHRLLAHIFADDTLFKLHPPLHAPDGLRDEGAANHTRLSPRYEQPGLHVFVYGTDGSPDDPTSARQSLSASERIATQHGLQPNHVLFLKQNPQAIEKGVFHNDVIAVGNENVYLCHEKSYANDREDLEKISARYETLFAEKMHMMVVDETEFSLEEAVQTYFFNSQLFTMPGGEMGLLMPLEVMEHPRARALAERLKNDSSNPINHIHFVDLRQSMRNGGGPACMRLRVQLDDAQWQSICKNSAVVVHLERINALKQLIGYHYPESLYSSQLGQLTFFHETQKTFDALADFFEIK